MTTPSSPEAAEPVLLEDREDGVAVLTLNRPDALNALNPPLMRALLEALERAAKDDTVGCVVLTGAGRGFCAGGDMKASARAKADDAGRSEASKAAERQPMSFEQRYDWVRRSVEAARWLHDMGKPTIAMINGPCAGAGLSLAGACDLRLAGASAVFAAAFVRAGISGDYGGSYFWTKILGSAKTRELYFLGEKLDAPAALAMGLVSKVHPDEDLRSATLEIAKRLATGPRAALRYAKANINLAEASDLLEVLDKETVSVLLSRQALVDSLKDR